VEDDLQPDEEGMAKYSSLITKFASDARELGSAAQAEIEPVVRKRKAAGADGDDSAKRVKKEDPDYDSIDWKQQLENDTVRNGETGKGATGTATGRLASVASSCRSSLARARICVFTCWSRVVQLRKLTIPALKVYCRQHKLPLAGTKEVLLERVTQHLLAA